MSPPDELTLGRLVLDAQGHIRHSSGELENDEHSGRVLHRLVARLPGLAHRVSLHYSDHAYVLTFAGSQLHVRKVSRQPNGLDPGSE